MNSEGQVLQDSQGKPKRVVLGEDGRTIFGDFFIFTKHNVSVHLDYITFKNIKRPLSFFRVLMITSFTLLTSTRKAFQL